MPSDADFLMRVLTRQVRLLSRDQAARIIASHSPDGRPASSLVARLLGEGLIDKASLAVAYPRVQERMLLWRRGHATPNHERTRWLLQRRWADLAPEVTDVYWATETGERRHGGVAWGRSSATQGSSPRSGGSHCPCGTHVEHDLGTAEVLTLVYERKRKWAADWIGEDLLKREYPLLKKRLAALPDAVTLRDGDLYKAIEFGGQYSVERLRRLHDAFSRRGIRYEIW